MRRLEWLGFGFFSLVAICMAICISVLSSLISSFQSVPQVWYWVIMLLLVVGLILFARSKLASIKKGKLFTFGTKDMTKGERVLYKCSYALMATGAILTLLFLTILSKM